MLEISTLEELDTPQKMQELIDFLERGKEFKKLALSKHELFRQLIPGNPSLIIRHACKFVNP